MAVRLLFDFWMFKHLEREKLQTETLKRKIDTHIPERNTKQ